MSTADARIRVSERAATERREYLQQMLREYGIPNYMWESVIQYILVGRPVGGFLTAVLNNDLKGAVDKGDNENQEALVRYMKFLYNHAPSGCYGYSYSTQQWLERGGLFPALRGEVL